jgi:hydroxymethylbilane synthase
MTRTVVLATRGSRLARRQAATVADALEQRRFSVEVETVSTRGDELRDELIHRLGTTGAFVRDLDDRVLSGEADLAVHSLKDVPTELPDDLLFAAVPERGRPEDVLVTPEGTALDRLPEGAVVGTASVRRRAQLLDRRPDLKIERLRGNVDTRVEKLLAPGLQRAHQRRLDAEDDEDDHDEFERSPQEWFDSLSELQRSAMGRQVDREYDAAVMAAVGLERAGLLDEAETTPLSPGEFVPSAGQGALVVTASDDQLARSVYDALDHAPTRVATTVERTVLAELGGGCVAPIGVHAVLRGGVVQTTVAVHGPDGERSVRESRALPAERHAEAAREFGADLRAAGTDELVAAATEE